MGFFVDAEPLVQTSFREIADYVKKTYPQHQASYFLSGADPWIIAHARVYGGRVVTFEKGAPHSPKAKIPDVCQQFGLDDCLNVYQMARELGMSL